MLAEPIEKFKATVVEYFGYKGSSEEVRIYLYPNTRFEVEDNHVFGLLRDERILTVTFGNESPVSIIIE